MDVEERLPWDEYYILLAVALDLDERDRYYSYIYAHGDPKKFKWASPDKAGTSGTDKVGLDPERVLRQAVNTFYRGQVRVEDLPKVGSVKDFMEHSGREKIRRVKREDGGFLYFGADGQEIQIPKGAVFVGIED